MPLRLFYNETFMSSEECSPVRLTFYRIYFIFNALPYSTISAFVTLINFTLILNGLKMKGGGSF